MRMQRWTVVPSMAAVAVLALAACSTGDEDTGAPPDTGAATSTPGDGAQATGDIDAGDTSEPTGDGDNGATGDVDPTDDDGGETDNDADEDATGADGPVEDGLAAVEACDLLDGTAVVGLLGDVTADEDATEQEWACTLTGSDGRHVAVMVGPASDAAVYRAFAGATGGSAWEEEFGDTESVVVSRRSANWVAIASATSGDYAFVLDARLEPSDIEANEQALRESIESLVDELAG